MARSTEFMRLVVQHDIGDFQRRRSGSDWIGGLDYILRGDFGRNQSHLIEGLPGVGKTTLALQFLVEGHVNGESGLFVCISETRDEICGIAASHGPSLEGVDVFELLSSEPARLEALN